MTVAPLFNSFFQGGFESSTHRLKNGKRLDLLAATRHDRWAEQDYRRLAELGLTTVRDGLRWHLIEPRPGHYDFSSVEPLLQARRQTGTQIIWDLFHYGWPDDLDIMKPEFVRRFAAYVRAVARYIREAGDEIPFYSPVNEISFVSWAGGDVAYLNPFLTGHGLELKAQLVRAAIEACEAVWEVDPRARITQIDPVINIVHDPTRPEDKPAADAYTQGQFQGWDMLAGREWPQLGGDPKYLDILGVNYYRNNQWIHEGRPLTRADPLYRPFRSLLQAVYERYRRPVFVAETGIEDEARPDWLAYIGQEVCAALVEGVDIQGICLYPILNHPGWDDDRHCYNGLFDYADENGQREIYRPLADELGRQQQIFKSFVSSEKGFFN